jgi:hypothetical protein
MADTASPEGKGLNPAKHLLLLVILLLAGCTGDSPEEGTTGLPSPETTTRSAVPEKPSTGEEPAYGYTYADPSGNLLAEGRGDLQVSRPVDVRLKGRPVWVAATSMGEDSVWVAILEDGRVQAFRLNNRETEPVPISPEKNSPGSPPLVKVEGDRVTLVTAQNENDSPLTHPTPLPGGGLLVVGEEGELFTEGGRNTKRINIQSRALPDARAVLSESGKAAVLTQPTRRYDHGVLGDGLEAGSLTVFGTGLEVSGRIRPASGGVFEAVAPLWFELRGQELLAVTESAEGEGSRISVYRPGGELVAAGPFVGQSQRWRHLLAAGPFGPEGEVELAAVRTPHIGGTVEFYGLSPEDEELEITGSVPGYASHRIDTRNLDTTLAGDLDGDGGLELLVPDGDYTSLGAIRRTSGGAETEWRLAVEGVISTNLASVTDSGGGISVGVGREDGSLRLWP